MDKWVTAKEIEDGHQGVSCIAGKRGDSTAGLKEQDGEIAVTGKAQAQLILPLGRGMD